MELAGKVIFLLMYTAVLKECWSYRILGIFPFPGSHMITFKRLMESLADRGHQVDVASRSPLQKPHANYTDIYLRIPSKNSMNINAENISTYKNFTSEVRRTYDDVLLIQSNLFNVHFIATELGNRLCEEGLMDPYLQNIIKNQSTKQPYDLVIVEIFAAQCFLAFGHHLKVPVVGVSSNALYPWSRGLISNPENLAIFSNNLLGLTQPINFWNRLYNTLYNVFFKYYYRYHSSIQTDIIRKHFGPNTPDIRELEDNIALILANSDPVLHGMVPKTPAFVEVGGLHIHDDNETTISADYKKWMDESDAGFIYFTLGSRVEIETFPPQALAAFYESFGKLSPMRVLMKIFDPKKLPPGLPENIRTFTRLPQIQVLKHKNIRAFITHGGLKGLQEAIYCAVPVIGIPLFVDQFLNVALGVKNNMAIQINLHDISQGSLDNALNEILHNPVYREAAKKMSDKFLDRPMSAIDTACYWVEYVGRHGSQALRSPAVDLAWWQVALLDVYLIILLFALLFCIVLVIIIYFSIRFCKRSFQKKKIF